MKSSFEQKIMTYETIANIANISLALSFLVALVFGIFQVRDATKDRRESRTMEALRNFQSRDFAEMDGRLTYHNSPKTFKEFEQLKLHEQAKYIQFGQEMEALGILVSDGLIEIDLVDKTLGSFVITAWEKYKPVFAEIRKRHSDPLLGEYFQWLAEYLNYRTQKRQRKPFYDTHRFNK